MAEVVKLITTWKEESVGPRKWNIPKHCVCSCYGLLYFTVSAELGKQEKQRNSGGVTFRGQENRRGAAVRWNGFRASATKGKSESVLSWKLAWMWRTNKNKSVYLKGATGEGRVIWKENHINLMNLDVWGLCARVNFSCDLTLWPRCYSSSPPFSPLFHLWGRFHHFTGSEELIKAEKNVAEEWIVSMTTHSSPAVLRNVAGCQDLFFCDALHLNMQ